MTHLPVLLAEAIDALRLRPDGLYVDGTFGRGGHSRLILERLGPQGRLIALDRDPQAVAAARAIADARFSITHASFSALAHVLDQQGAALAQGMLFDLGVSSPQLDDPARGFSFRAAGPLDMRMDPTHGMSAADWLAAASTGRCVPAAALIARRARVHSEKSSMPGGALAGPASAPPGMEDFSL